MSTVSAELLTQPAMNGLPQPKSSLPNLSRKRPKLLSITHNSHLTLEG